MSGRANPGAQERSARGWKHRRVVSLHKRQWGFGHRNDTGPLHTRHGDGAPVTDIRIGEFETGLFVVLLLRHHTIEPEHPRTSVGEGRVPYVQSIAAATQIFSHDVQAKEGESSAVIDAGDRRGWSAFEFANQETIRIYLEKQAASARPGFQFSAAAQSTAIEISSGRMVRMRSSFIVSLW